MIGWNFPENNYGRREGLNDSGIETFKGVPYESLAREIIQNSLDAKQTDSKKPVVVHFQLYKNDKNLFPCHEEYQDILKRGKEFWKDRSEDTVHFYNNAIAVLNADAIPILKISDYNTTGLLGASDESQGYDWENLIRSSGASNKGAGKGGSFGIGKNAPFACSDLRTLFYSTCDTFGTKAFQGVATITTHHNQEGKETRGTGFYGKKDKNQPIFDFDFVDEFFRREDIGTDIFIFGFKKLKNWQDEIIKSVIENFFLSIHEGKLVVQVQDTIITSTTLPVLLKENIFKSPDCLAPYYYKALISPDRHPFLEENFLNLGKIELFLLPEKNFPKRVAIIRKTGMKIFDKDRFQTPIQFSGVFVARGDGINNFMRKIEPPSHNAWEADRYDDPAEARKTIKQIYVWLNEYVRTLVNVDDSEELDVEGISEFLPDDSEEFENEAFDSDEGVSGVQPKDVEIKIITPKTSAESATQSSISGEDGTDEGGVYTAGENQNDATGGEQQTQTSRSIGEGEGTGLDSSDENGAIQTKASAPIKLKRVRTFCTDATQGKYKVIFEPLNTCSGTLKINTVGDDGKLDPAPIVKATYSANGSELTFDSSGKIGPLNFIEGNTDSIEVVLEDGLHCAMEVNANAY